ncbi:Pickpocket protein 19 [Pseudolycoriella hygida]|uniref:Pickpocket protein 19 n=1 Tax=Pseudolycoriella hygida TaxID=35572 RepID=A0A9Q0RXB5_9DIPT|nr:Pickpocket protein 19 [Pseudolycoriella hygida]
MANHPFSWPGSAYFVPKGTSTGVIIKPSYSYTTSDVQRLLPADRKCLYPNEYHKYEFETLPGTLYFRLNCLAECRQKQMITNCNCTVDFLYPTADYPVCKISDFKCLYNYDTLFNFERPPKGNPYFSEDEVGLSCECLPECESIDYSLDVSPIPRLSNDAENAILVDIHFQQSTMVKYRTSVVFGWLDLMVAFGGIAGLFLGCSLISVAEVVYYFAIGLTKLSLRKFLSLDRKRKDAVLH